jgi:small multidrug resistance pump
MPLDRVVSYIYLMIAIFGEVLGTTALKASDGFTRPMPSALTIVAYGVTFYFLSLALRAIPTGVAYAIWSGVGIVVISIISWVWFKQQLDAAAIAGMALICAGVVVINVFSKSMSH